MGVEAGEGCALFCVKHESQSIYAQIKPLMIFTTLLA